MGKIGNYLIAMYDMEENLVASFDSYDECASFIGVDRGDIMSYICRTRKGDNRKKRFNGRWYKLYKVEYDDEYGYFEGGEENEENDSD